MTKPLHGIDHIGVTIVSILHDGRGNILLQKRGPKARDEHGRWDATSGALEHGELIEDTLKREIDEELSTEPLTVKFLGVYEVHREHNGQKTHWIAIAHAVKVDPKTIKIGEPDKIAEVGWFHGKNLPKPLHSQFSKVHQSLIDNGILR